MGNQPLPSTAASTGPGLLRGEFRRVAEAGFGEGENSYPHAMAWYKDRLYVGTTRCVLALLYNRFDDIKAWKPFPVKPAKTSPFKEFDTRGQIWRYAPHDNTWEKVMVSPMCKSSINGEDLPVFAGVRNMMPFARAGESEPLLYAMAWSARGGPGPLLFQTADGDHWKRLDMRGIAAHEYSTFRPLVKFKGRLFTAPTGRPGSANAAGVAIVYENADPEHENWVQANELSFGDPLNQTIFEMCVFNDHLYAGTMNPKGFQLWKTDAEGKPPYKWKLVITDGAGRGQNNEAIGSMAVFNGSLIVGTAINNGGYDRIYGIGPAPVEILRVHADDSWDLLMGEGRLTKQGWKIPLSGYGAGFDRFFNTYLWRMCVHDGWLYTGTFCLNWLLKFIPRDKWPEDKKRMMDDERTTLVADRLGGFDLWRTRDGEVWSAVTRTGFGNPWNYGIRTMVSTPVGMFVGTANPFGPLVAVKGPGGWRYETNPRGGLEVWLGSHDLKGPPTPTGHPPPNEPLFPREIPLHEEDLRQEVEDFAGYVISEFYNGTDWRCFGFWDATISKPVRACHALFRELFGCAADAGPSCWLMGNIGADAARYALNFRKASDVRVVVEDQPARDRIQKANPDLAVMPLEQAGGTPLVVAVDAFTGRAEASARWMAMLKSLEAGGVLAGAEALSAGAGSPWLENLRGAESREQAIAAFRRFLESQGLVVEKLEDVTHPVWKSFRQRLDLLLWEKVIESELDDSLIAGIEQRLFGFCEPVLAYVMYRVRKA